MEKIEGRKIRSIYFRDDSRIDRVFANQQYGGILCYNDNKKNALGTRGS
jgi:hypothetical protein